MLTPENHDHDDNDDVREDTLLCAASALPTLSLDLNQNLLHITIIII